MSDTSNSHRDSRSPAIFIDRDGTINEDRGYISSPEGLVLYPWAAEAIRLVNGSEFKAIVVTNQSGIARGFYSEEALEMIHRGLIDRLGRKGARLDAIYYCPHHPRIGGERYRLDCDCRKPRPALLFKAAGEHGIDLSRSYVIGDKASDINLAACAGARSVLVLTGYGAETFRRIQDSMAQDATSSQRGFRIQGENEERLQCAPDIVADNLLEAVRHILDKEAQRLEITNRGILNPES